MDIHCDLSFTIPKVSSGELFICRWLYLRFTFMHTFFALIVLFLFILWISVKYCRYAGQPLSARRCLNRISKLRLYYPVWSLSFFSFFTSLNNKKNVKLSKFNRNITSRKFQTNAWNLGIKLASIVQVTVKTSPEKQKLLQPTLSRRLAGKIFDYCIFHFINIWHFYVLTY